MVIFYDDIPGDKKNSSSDIICILNYFPKYYDKKNYVQISENIKEIIIGKFYNLNIAIKFGNSINAEELEKWGYFGEYDSIEIKCENIIEAMRSI